MRRRFSALLCMTAALAACGGGGGGGGGGDPVTITPTPTPTPTPTGGCSLSERQNWAAGVLNEWYLLPSLLATGVNPGSYSTVDDYIDALTAPARAQGKDRFFTYLTSIAADNAFFSSGQNAGFGFRLSSDLGAQKLWIAEAFEGAPALAAGMDRGTEVLAIGETQATLQLVTQLIASGGTDAINNAIGPSTPGLTRWFRIRNGTTTTEVAVTKTNYTLTPVSSRYGALVLNDGGTSVGYLNLRTFIDTADPALRTAFANFRSQGITKVIVDLRYNGGGLVSIGELLSNLLGGNRFSSDIIDKMVFRPEKSSNNSTEFFNPQPQSVSPVKIAFIGTGGTASASELVINSFLPYLQANVGLIGTNTYGKPVGQIGVDKSSCDDRLRVMAFSTQNGAGQGEYFSGLAPFMQSTCQAADDITKPFGDPTEASVKGALDFLAGRSCTPISGGISTQAVGGRRLVQPHRPTTAQHEVPGSY